ncbi:MAG TPA: hypothetical protein VGF17_16335 [Phytomonospora sp.]
MPGTPDVPTSQKILAATLATVTCVITALSFPYAMLTLDQTLGCGPADGDGTGGGFSCTSAAWVLAIPGMIVVNLVALIIGLRAAQRRDPPPRRRRRPRRIQVRPIPLRPRPLAFTLAVQAAATLLSASITANW